MVRNNNNNNNNNTNSNRCSIRFITTTTLLWSLSLCLVCASGASAATDYEVWAADQANTAPGQVELGVKGGSLWIYDSASIEKQLRRLPWRQRNAVSLPCSPSASQGPCNAMDMFPQSLTQTFANGSSTGKTLGELAGFGRLHGVVLDPFQRYVNVNFFAPDGGFLGVIDVQTKEVIALFQLSKLKFATGPNTTTAGRSVHMSFWGTDGSSIVMSNLNGKAIERINVERDLSNTITGLSFDRSATLGLGKNMTVLEEATYFTGNNAFGRPLKGAIIGSYSNADLNDLTPNGHCKETGCISTVALPMSMGGRPSNSPICPIVSPKNHLFVTLAGGGLFIAEITSTPMRIIGEFESNIVQGAGCGGVAAKSKVFLNAGVSAGAAGANQSAFTLYAFEDAAFQSGVSAPANTPLPDVVTRDEGNTLTLGNVVGSKSVDLSGQFPSNTTRRDSHGMIATVEGKFVHVMDRIQNTIESFDAETYDRTTYDTTSYSGRSSSKTLLSGLLDQLYDGPCASSSVEDDPMLPKNDPAPDLSDPTPDGKYIMVALRGPLPVSVPHGSQGSCPGVGIVKLSRAGKRGRLVSVMRTTNTIADSVLVSASTTPGGHQYMGAERSDIHDVIVVPK